MPDLIELIASVLFAIAIIHTFSVPVFARLSHRGGRHAGLWHMLSEVEAVFGVWAFILLVIMALLKGTGGAVAYMDTRNFTEPAFVFAIMVVAASRPILELVGMVVQGVARVLPFRTELATYFLTLSLVPLSGSFITEPAAMTLAALLLRDGYFRHSEQTGFKYMTLGVLFVNVSIGGVLTSYAAPPVLMVAHTFGWDATYMATHFGWRAACAVIINAAVLTLICRKYLLSGELGAGRNVDADGPGQPKLASAAPRAPVPALVMAIHLLFLLGVVLGAHHPTIFLGLLMFFIGYTEAYKGHQDTLMIKEGLLVGFFLAGLVVLGGLQKWWLQDLLAGLQPVVLYWGATALTAVTDNAALTYLGSMVDGTSDLWRYMLVAGAVTGGGLTVIANAPNPAGFSILKNYFPDGAISPIKLLAAAAIPTLVAAFMFLLPNSFG
ncbi:putative Na+/H+ antiporter [Paralcaligenes ureilyticus]|uniref:Putative Na+/H+ antiporter n=1 Tax=Paralcaligenes ureilyticus TaxID=627131 RepID=A0A4V2UYG8_9BURK|nr:putative Na+/H+ antiporter [Paralcaligenes ureilyticus]TCT07398.1 putative Na+/H+ antiporter [Paralcaligenes ureilyticus]